MPEGGEIYEIPDFFKLSGSSQMVCLSRVLPVWHSLFGDIARYQQIPPR